MKEYEVEKEWISEAGLKCVVLALCAGHRCGYVGIDKDNQFFGKDYNDKIDISEEQKEKILSSYVGERGLVSLIAFNCDEDFRADIVFDVHGGIKGSLMQEMGEVNIPLNLIYGGLVMIVRIQGTVKIFL